MSAQSPARSNARSSGNSRSAGTNAQAAQQQQLDQIVELQDLGLHIKEEEKKDEPRQADQAVAGEQADRSILEQLEAPPRGVQADDVDEAAAEDTQKSQRLSQEQSLKKARPAEVMRSHGWRDYARPGGPSAQPNGEDADGANAKDPDNTVKAKAYNDFIMQFLPEARHEEFQQHAAGLRDEQEMGQRKRKKTRKQGPKFEESAAARRSLELTGRR